MRRLLLSSILFAVVGVFSLGMTDPLHAEAPPHDLVKAQRHVKVGALVDLTGPEATRERLNLRGMEDYFRYINEFTSGMDGRKLALTPVDAGIKPDRVLRDVERMCVSEKVETWTVWDVLMCEKTKPLFVKHQIPHMDATHCRNLHPPASYTYLPFGGATLNCHALLQYIEMTHEGSDPPRVGLLAANDACGKSILNPSKTYGENHRLQIVAVLKFTPGTRNLESAMLELKARGAEYILLQCSAPDAITALKSADRIRYPVPFFSTWILMDTDFSALEKGLIRNRLNVSFPGCLPGDGSPGIQLIRVLMDRYKSVSRFQTAYWEGVSIAAIMARALQKAHQTLGKIDRQTVNLALETFQREDFGALVPEITYTDTDHSASSVTRIVRVNENHTFTPLTEFWNPKTEKVTIIP